MIRNQLNLSRINAVHLLKQKTCRTPVGLTRASIHLRQNLLLRRWIAGSSPAMTIEQYNAHPGHDQSRFPFTASARLAFAEPGFSGCCWLSCGAQPESQITSKVARMRPAGSAKRSAQIGGNSHK